MKLLHACCLVSHSVIAGAYAHECLLDPTDLHKHVVTAGYFALTIMQGIFVYLVFKDAKHPAKLPPL